MDQNTETSNATTDEAQTFDHTATFSPQDNKLRLFFGYRLDKAEWNRLKGLGFTWTMKQASDMVATWTPEREDACLRLLSAKERNDLDAERRAAMAPRFHALANRGAPMVITSHNLFPTPVDVVARMMVLADVRPGMRVLEPSAGTGRILSALPAGCDVVAVELSPDLQRYLYGAFPGAVLKGGDFLARSDLGTFDRVVMNPPFQRGEDVRHIMHARSMLKPGGRLVSLCYDGAKQNRDLRPIATSWEVLPAGSFKSEGTDAGVVLLTIDAPGAVVSL